MSTINIDKISSEIKAKYKVVNNSFRLLAKDNIKDLQITLIQ